MIQVALMCPDDGGELHLDVSLSRRTPTMVCERCGNRYPFAPNLQKADRLRSIYERTGMSR